MTAEQMQPAIKKTILIVDDTELNRDVLSIIFASDYRTVCTSNGVEALEAIDKYRNDLVAVLLDYNMPEMNGFAFIEEAKRRGLLEKVPVFLITAGDDADLARKAFEMGVMDFIKRPLSAYIVQKRVESIIELFETRRQLADLLSQHLGRIEKFSHELIDSFSSIISAASEDKGEHARRVTAFTRVLLDGTPAGKNMSGEEARLTVEASALLDIGKLSRTELGWSEPEHPCREEIEEMSERDMTGAGFLARLSTGYEKIPVLRIAHDIVSHQHETWDGKGFPRGLKGDEIPLSAQVVSLAGLFDSLASRAEAPDGKSLGEVCRRIASGEFGGLNPLLLESLGMNLDKIKNLYKKEN